jgi:hypothetical protein
MVNGLFRDHIATLQHDRQRPLGRYEIIDIAHEVVEGRIGRRYFVRQLRDMKDSSNPALHRVVAEPAAPQATGRQEALTPALARVG